MKVYDCFSYWDEDLLLDLRLNILNNYVDFFVIVEGNKTWQNNHKEFRFDIDKFENFKSTLNCCLNLLSLFSSLLAIANNFAFFVSAKAFENS